MKIKLDKGKLKDKTFWIALIPAVLLLIQLVLKLFGVHIVTDELQKNLLEIVNVVFVILVITGVVVEDTSLGGDKQEEEDK